MRDFKKQRSASHEVFNFFVLCGGILLILGLATVSVQAAWGMYTKFVVASQGDAAAKKELAQLELQHGRVSAAVADLSSGRGVEGQIRERFGVAKPGEGAIMIVRSGTSTAGEQNLNKENIFSRVFHALFVW
jgi:cell division protein FtsB